MINLEKTKYHGASYDEVIDRHRLNGQLLRLYEVLKDGQGYEAPELCRRAQVSFASLRNRVSDLRVYHGIIIETSRVKEGLFAYRYKGVMTTREHEVFVEGLRAKRAGKKPGTLMADILTQLSVTHRKATGGVKSDIAFMIHKIEKELNG